MTALLVSQMRRARVSAALRAIEEGTRLDDLTDDETDTIIDAARDHRADHEPRAVEVGLREALRASLAKRSRPTMDPPWTAAFNAALDMVATDVAPFLAAQSPAPTGGGETWETINQWCDDTFGLATIPQIIARAKEEFTELEEPNANHAIEAADVVICLCRIPGFAGALQTKMAINRKRKWRLTGDGTGYHIPDAARPSTQPQADAGSLEEVDHG